MALPFPLAPEPDQYIPTSSPRYIPSSFTASSFAADVLRAPTAAAAFESSTFRRTGPRHPLLCMPFDPSAAVSSLAFAPASVSGLASNARILFTHIIPHLIPTMLVWATLGIATTVLLEATLSFLGIGVQPPMPSWGNIIQESVSYFTTAPWLVFIPGAAILLLALSFNLVGDALRDVLDPTQRGRS